MEKRTSIKISRTAHRVFKDIARQFEVGDREMNIIELFDKLSQKKVELMALIRSK